MKQVKIGLVGIGAVGAEMIKVLRQREFPASEIRIFARSERDEIISGETFHVTPASPDAFDGLDIVLFAGTEGAKGASRQLGWEAVKRGAVVIDNGDDFRMDPRVPLVIPEINGAALDDHKGFIANPNCSTIITLMGLAPLHRAAGIRHFTAVTFQSVSGSGKKAVDELYSQAKAWGEEQSIVPEVYPRQILFNVIPQIGSEKPEMPGFTSEEAKMLFETRKILGDDQIRVASTCVRVPVFQAHSVAIHAQFEKPLSAEAARTILKSAPGVEVCDDLATASFPTPLEVQGRDVVCVGRIRVDTSVENGLALWTVGDNIRKGAAQNAVQIAEELIRRDLLGFR